MTLQPECGLHTDHLTNTHPAVINTTAAPNVYSSAAEIVPNKCTIVLLFEWHKLNPPVCSCCRKIRIKEVVVGNVNVVIRNKRLEAGVERRMLVLSFSWGFSNNKKI